ncbi:MAG TPA: chlorite dismutase family protein [Candidatus Sulfotelmatobacter sp.]|nr:chlorite dismutase family protein [Candidatus Sulfotelmatobacter sp.]
MARPADVPNEGGAESGRSRQFVNFAFCRVDPAWRRLSSAERDRGKKEYKSVVEEFGSRMLVLPYTTVGIRADTDLLLWRISAELDLFQQMSTKLLGTGLGGYLLPAYSYLAMTKRSTYVDKLDPSHPADRTRIVPGKSKYLFVYPFVKSRDWYRLTQAARQGMMDEHIAVGSRYRSVKLNTTYSYGLDDQEFVVAFETDAPADFLDLVMELRGTEASRFTARDTPTFTCLARSLDDALDSLG